jgi:hypothetical protein
VRAPRRLLMPTLDFWLARAGFKPTLIECAPALRTGGLLFEKVRGTIETIFGDEIISLQEAPTMWIMGMPAHTRRTGSDRKPLFRSR